MSKLGILFWVACVGAILWCGAAAVWLLVSSSYHSMAAKGDLLHVLRVSAVVLAVLAFIVMLVLRVRRGAVSTRTYGIGSIVLAVIAVIPVLPRIDSGYVEAVVIGGQRHDIPWQYDPYGHARDGEQLYIQVRVELPDMSQSYRALSQTITLRKAVDFNYGRGGAAQEEICEGGQYNTACEWQEGAFVYRVYGATDTFPEDTDQLRADVVTLLDSFVVAE